MIYQRKRKIRVDQVSRCKGDIILRKPEATAP